MLVVCHHVGDYYLTFGKTYVAHPISAGVGKMPVGIYSAYSNNYYFIVNDIGQKFLAEKSLFTPLDQVRQTKLNDLGI